MSNLKHTKTKGKKQLTKKEAYLVWSIICWFERPLITSTLKYKLYPQLGHETQQKMRAKYDTEIIKRIVELGLRINKHHPEWLLWEENRPLSLITEFLDEVQQEQQEQVRRENAFISFSPPTVYEFRDWVNQKLSKPQREGESL